MSTEVEVDYDEMIDAFVQCWTEVDLGHRSVRTAVGPYEIVVRRRARGEVGDLDG